MLGAMSTSIPEPKSGISGRMRATTLPSEEEARRLHQIAETKGLEVFAAVELEKVEGREGLLVFTGSGPEHGSLWVQGAKYHAQELGRDKVRVVFEGKPVTPRFLIPASSRELPATLSEWQVRQERRRQALERQRQEAEKERKAAAATAKPVTWANLHGAPGLPVTLRAVAEQLHDLGGTIRIEAGRVVVALPARALTTPYATGPKLAAYLYAAHEAIVEAVKGRAGPVAIAKLPERELLPSGHLAP
jgi:hypothetical protein